MSSVGSSVPKEAGMEAAKLVDECADGAFVHSKINRRKVWYILDCKGKGGNSRKVMMPLSFVQIKDRRDVLGSEAWGIGTPKRQYHYFQHGRRKSAYVDLDLEAPAVGFRDDGKMVIATVPIAVQVASGEFVSLAAESHVVTTCMEVPSGAIMWTWGLNRAFSAMISLTPKPCAGRSYPKYFNWSDECDRYCSKNRTLNVKLYNLCFTQMSQGLFLEFSVQSVETSTRLALTNPGGGESEAEEPLDEEEPPQLLGVPLLVPRVMMLKGGKSKVPKRDCGSFFVSPMIRSNEPLSAQWFEGRMGTERKIMLW